jgi:hypothetical protein
MLHEESVQRRAAEFGIRFHLIDQLRQAVRVHGYLLDTKPVR